MSDSPWMHISVSEGESERSQGALRFMRGGCEEGLVGVGAEEGLVGGLVSRLVSRISTDALCPECQPAPSRGFLAPILMLSGGLPTSPAGSGRRVHQRYLGQRLLLKVPPSGLLVPQPFPGPAAQPLWLRSTPAPPAEAARSLPCSRRAPALPHLCKIHQHLWPIVLSFPVICCPFGPNYVTAI